MKKIINLFLITIISTTFSLTFVSKLEAQARPLQEVPDSESWAPDAVNFCAAQYADCAAPFFEERELYLAFGGSESDIPKKLQQYVEAGLTRCIQQFADCITG